MANCSKCGSENAQDAIYCEGCGIQLKKEGNGEISKLIKIKAIILGTITASLFYILLLLIFSFSLNPEALPESLFIALNLILQSLPILGGGIIGGYFSRKIYLSGIINGAILAILMMILFLGLDFSALLIGIFINLPSGVAGGFIGVFIQKKKNMQ